jgi:putative SOS response-associated peptidase YedK
MCGRASLALREPEIEEFLRTLRVTNSVRWPQPRYSLINARAETVAAKPAFRNAFRSRRGLVVVDGFYEWRRNATGPKTPMRIRRRDRAPLTLAALWETWGEGGEHITTCSIVTTSPNEIMAPIHNRMPVILTDEAPDVWLDPRTATATLGSLMVPDRSKALEVYAVTPLVNSPRNDRPECWAAVS